MNSPSLLTFLPTVVWLQASPQVVERVPADGAKDLDPAINELRVTFDQDMGGGMSWTGGGPRFPKATGKPRWIDKRTCVMPVALEAGKRYELGINAPSFQNFRSAAGVPAEPVSWTFKTRPAGLPPDPVQQGERNRAGFEDLKKALRERYSYYEHRKIDWPARFKAFEPKLLAAGRDDDWAETAAEMLSVTNDLHLWFEYGDEVFAAGRRVQPPLDWAAVERTAPRFKKLGATTARGRTDDEIGYVLIASWSRDAAPEIGLVEQAIESMLDCRSIIVDVRPNSGGDELLARRVAAWFVDQPKVYSRNRTRDPDAPGGWTETFDRVIEPRGDGKHFAGNVTVLIGPANMSSCESFILMMKHGAGATLAGQKTWGSSGNPKPHKLSNGVTVLLPSWEDQQPDGSIVESRGIEPDVTEPTASSAPGATDIVLEHVLQRLRSR